MDTGDQRPSAALLDLVNGFKVSQALHVASRLGVADLLKDGARRSDDLAAATGTHPPSLYRVLRALASVGVFREDADRCFALTPLGEVSCMSSSRICASNTWSNLKQSSRMIDGAGGNERAANSCKPWTLIHLVASTGRRLRRASMLWSMFRKQVRNCVKRIRCRTNSRASRSDVGGIHTAGNKSARSNMARRAASTRSFLSLAAAMALVCLG